MARDGLAEAVRNLPAGWQGHYFPSLDSTQDAARTAARGGAPGRSIFVADFQSAGRGRHGRAWLSSPGEALLMSIVFRELTPWRWTTLTSVALAEAIEQRLSHVKPAIKWPNDVLVNDRKVAGVLAENAWDGSEVLSIVGVGVNIGSAPKGLDREATSLREAAGGVVDRGDLLLAFVRSMDRWLALPTTTIHAAWESRLWGRGQTLRLVDLGREERVVVLGADADGALRVKLADGTVQRTMTGELIP
jgi:BirA family biotin operon repressor/biotin-[acetyl-CoA-carboxylase] ligase